ncbi:MAG: fructose-1,6-bisphosphatase/inositol monophosphatase family enzyme [Lysobacterales bacterium]|jgi:fructose-1,6-bisphosphatase/inositol monophosphatase family enzyme
MILSKDDLKILCDIAISVAREAGALINSYVGSELVVNEKKEGLSRAAQVVTEVDLKSQEVILKSITPTCEAYDLGLLCEEGIDDYSRLKKDYFWCIDPLDGTLPFIESRAGYAVSIALVSKEGVPTIGVIYEPLTQTLYHAIDGMGAFRNERPWHLEQDDSKSSTTIDLGGAVMNACWVLERSPASFNKKPKSEDGGGCLWDYAATACLFKEMGAWVSDSFGNPLDLNREDSTYMNHKGFVFASNSEIAKLLL